ncbi:Hsp70 family protein [Aspergillus ibericus CBS 121593]|uniref:Actin-like ATPase domain-containing protein n=1 Tax=Aspergillus ibericus CBS 121593 TaxID=1448316 RepID=A0A395H0R5_9EURO|nr:actin-like ATPase domain-containing protein [Aspergillus ibericus CBS 121593]RAL01421.1 actin-like ATPase domain-containing protein [Aspergillus ibericus CBS 121593]
MENPRIVIGLDFGTTYSGVAWALSDCPDKSEVITSWPGSGNRTVPKVPSTMLFKCGGRFQWGYQTSFFGDHIRGVKILLDGSQDRKYVAALESAGFIKRNRKTAIDLAGQYLEQLVLHTETILQRRFGTAVQGMEMRYVLTVPAVWSDKAKDATLKAALKAGISPQNVSLVSEPEAAALHCMGVIQPNSIQDGDVVVVCDAGGGTVDLISYCVKSVSPLRLEEAVEGTGGICGSMMLDVGFTNFLKSLLGRKIPDKAREIALRFWQDNIKPNFANDPDFLEEIHFVPLPGVKDCSKIGLQDGFLQMDGTQIKAIFDPIVGEVQTLVCDQVTKARASGTSVKAILLVGGFGSSEYLYQCIQKAHDPIIVMQPPNSPSGAVRHGIEDNQVGKRIARRHYGILYRSCCPEYLVRYPVAARTWCTFKEKWYVHNLMRWYIQKGEELLENQPIRMTFERVLPYGREPIFYDRLYLCGNYEAPERLNDETVWVCEMKSDLRGIPTSLFLQRINSKGEQYYSIQHDLIMTPLSGTIKFELEFNGASYGQVETTY